MRFFIVVVAAVLSVGACRAANPAQRVRFVEPWGAVFGGEPTTFHVEVGPDTPRTAKLGWALTVARRTVARREVAIDDGKARIEVQVPPVRDGIHVRALLKVELINAGRSERTGATRVLHIFGKNPFADRRTWLRELDLRLFDPEKDTAKLFEEEEIPYKIIRDPRRLEDARGLLIVGEKREFQAKSSVLAALAEFAERGGRVLVLAPGEGSLRLPGSGKDSKGKTPSVALRHADVIHDLDKRLDAAGWPPVGKLASCGFALESRHPDVVLSVNRQKEGWPWVSLDYPAGGQMILCAFPIVETWAESPNARMLFLAVLAEFAEYEQRAGETEK